MGLSVVALTVVVGTTLLYVVGKLYIVFSTAWNRSPVCLVGKTAIITGSNIGVGYYTALDLAMRGARVILACRNRDKAEEAKTKIIEATGNNQIVVKILDLSSLLSVRQFAKDVIETEDRLDILVNNAGAAVFSEPYTNDCLRASMQVNHLGPFLLTILLTDLLKKTAPSRVVIVSSLASCFGKLNVDDLNAPNRLFVNALDYANSKLCNLLFTIELAQKLKGTGVTANAVHPGIAKSDIIKDAPTLFSKFIGILTKLFSKSTEAGAQTLIYTAVAKELNGVSGKFFGECVEIAFPQSTQNKMLPKMLWNKSEEFVQLTVQEKQYLYKL